MIQFNFIFFLQSNQEHIILIQSTHQISVASGSLGVVVEGGR